MAEGLEFVPSGGAGADNVDNGGPSEKRLANRRRCGKCRKSGHNSRTCQENAKMSSESDADN